MMIRDEQGGSLVEFAIISPLLLVILFGIIEFGILLYDKAMLTNACREGARAGIVFSDPRLSDAKIIKVVKDYCDDYLISPGSGSTLVNIPPPSREVNANGEECIRVTAQYPFRFLVFSNVIALIGGPFEDIVNLNAVTVMRME